MTRVPHVLKPTTGIRRPQRIVFFDTETAQIGTLEGKTEHVLKLGVAMYCELDDRQKLQVIHDIDFYDFEELWDWIDGFCWGKTLLYVVAHNIIFDLVVCHGFSELYSRGWTLSSYYSKRMTNILRWKKDKARLLFLDNGNLFSGRLATWGKRVGVPKIEIDFATCGIPELLIYCRNDVTIMVKLWDTWLSFLDDHDCGSFKVTVASTAFNTWRHRFLDNRLHIHDNSEVLELEREAYRGGRTECLWVGKRSDGPFYYLDINSMYGYVLRNELYPAGLWSHIVTDSLWVLKYKLERFGVIAKVRVNVTEPWFAFDIDRHTVFPTGEFDVTLTTPELNYAISRNWITKVYSLSTYRMLPLFKSMVDYFHQLRSEYGQSGDVGYANICKLMINSFYGKFGQRGFVQKVIGKCEIDKVETWEVYDTVNKRFYNMVYIGGTVFNEYQEGESYHSFPAIAAHVTAYARLYLNTFRMLVPQGSVFYMDTDSLIVDQVGYDALSDHIIPGMLGKLKVEHTSDELIIHAAKDYQMGERIRSKGIRQSAKFIAANTFLQEQWPGLQGLIRGGNLDTYQVKQITKHQRRIIYSGLVEPSGWVSSFHLTVEQEPLIAFVPRKVLSVYPTDVS